MATPANLNDISQALANLLEFNVKRLAGTAITGVPVSRLPPEKADDRADTRLNVHLYHVSQDNDGGADLPEGQAGRNPIATRPMALKLFYVLTAHAKIDSTTDDVASQHALMGWALKTLHDFGEIFEDTQIGSQKLFNGVTLGGRPIEIIIRPIEPEDSVSFWSVDKERSARLSAFLELRTLLLTPDPPRSAGSPVMELGLGAQPGGTPVLTASQSSIMVTRPAAFGGDTITIPASPAIGVLRAAAGSNDAVVSFTGSALGDGTDGQLVLRGEGLAGPLAIDPADNPDWQILITDSSLRMAVRPEVWGALPGELAKRVRLAPGVYSLALLRRRRVQTERGAPLAAAVESNRQPLILAPAIVAAGLKPGPDPRNVLVMADPGVLLDAAGGEVMLGISGEAYNRVAALAPAPASNLGKFLVTGPQAIEAFPLSGQTPAAGAYQLRLTVNGADAPPAWLEVP